MLPLFLPQRFPLIRSVPVIFNSLSAPSHFPGILPRRFVETFTGFTHPAATSDMPFAIFPVRSKPIHSVNPPWYSFLPADRPISLKPSVRSSSVVFFFHATTSDIVFTDAAVTIRGGNHYSISVWLHDVIDKMTYFMLISVSFPQGCDYSLYIYYIVIICIRASANHLSVVYVLTSTEIITYYLVCSTDCVKEILQNVVPLLRVLKEHQVAAHYICLAPGHFLFHKRLRHIRPVLRNKHKTGEGTS